MEKWNKTSCSHRDIMDKSINISFYARVSTEHEEQINALENQIQWYDDLLKLHPNWNKVKIYTDQGITGTQAEKRPGFMEMIEDAKKGKFTLIVTREVSRFARNTIDSLMYTRMLKMNGVEVFFYNDNIWSFDKDGEFRLTIMSAMSQEESSKLSTRVKSGQKISRENGVLYGNGNILGYRLVRGAKSTDNTYEIIEEQAETVRMIYNLYLKGYGAKKIARILVERRRKKAMGGMRWCSTDILRILSNKSYCGYIGYNKSQKKDFLDKSRTCIRDSSQYVYMKGNFPAIISEEQWNEVQKIKQQKTIKVQKVTNGRRRSKDPWSRKLVCECGSTYHRYRWRTNNNGTVAWGYQCFNQIRNRKKSFYLKQGLDGEGYCDIPAICQWKLDFMCRNIVSRLWTTQNEDINELIQVIEKNMVKDSSETDITIESLEREKERLERRKSQLIDFMLDGQIDKKSYKVKATEIDESLIKVDEQLTTVKKEKPEVLDSDNVKKSLQKVKEFIESYFTLEEQFVSEDLIEGIIERVVPTENGVFKWYLNVCDCAILFQEREYIKIDEFALGFDEAKAYRKKFGSFLRFNQWKDLMIEVYIKM